MRSKSCCFWVPDEDDGRGKQREMIKTDLRVGGVGIITRLGCEPQRLKGAERVKVTEKARERRRVLQTA